MLKSYPSRRDVLTYALAAGSARAQVPARAAAPNIVLIAANELPACMLGCYGNREIRTPSIDLLAAGGLRLTNYYAASPSARPNLASLLTGRAARQHGVPDAYDSRPVSLEKERQLPEILGAAGYRTATGLERAPEVLTPGTSPFFLYVPLPAPQEPYSPIDPAYAGTSFTTLGWDPPSPRARRGKDNLADIRASLRRYASAVTAMDHSVGELLRLIDTRGVRAQTLIVLTSATGMLGGRHGLWSDGLGSDPVNMYEESVRLPLIWNWPGRTPVEAARSELVGCCDLLPTLCDAAGINPPEGRNLPGRSFLPLATGRPFPKKQPWRSLVFASLLDTTMARDTRFKLVLRDRGPGELFDLRNDARERVNQFANPSYLEARERLTRDCQSWIQSYSS